MGLCLLMVTAVFGLVWWCGFAFTGVEGLQLWWLLFICYLDCLVEFVTPARGFVTFVVLFGVRGGC